MTQANFKDEWLNKAFQLAFFIHGERGTAKRIAAAAMDKLEVASNAQFKRYYYTPTGRAETARATRSRVSLNDLQLLQRLVFVESENFEREKERAEKTSEKSLLIHFIKHLVRISLKRNSFYVTLAVSRILHNYGTADAMEIYNIVVQDPERVHDDYYYRSRKGVLMKELKARFDGFLETVKVNRGEERFDFLAEAENLTPTARNCLKFFTPWNSRCALPEKFDPFSDIIKPFYFDKNDPDEEHLTEVNRIHATLHPNCFSRLTEALKLPSSEEKMEIPKFMIKDRTANFDDDWNEPPDLDADELAQIKAMLTAQAESRRALSANVLRVVADGAETARINLEETGAVDFDLDESAELIEVRVIEKDGDVVLATHLLSFDELEKGGNTQTVVLEGGQKVSFDFKPEFDEYGEITGLKCAVNYAETAWQKRLGLALRRTRFALAAQNWILKPALTFGLLLLTLIAGWIIFQRTGSEKGQLANSSQEPNLSPGIVLPENSNTRKNQEVANKNDLPKNPELPKLFVEKEPKKDLATNKKPETPEKIVPEKQFEVKNPQEQVAINKPLVKKENTDENGVLRVPIRGHQENNKSFPFREGPSRNGNGRPFHGKPLSEIRQIFIEISGDTVLGNRLRDEISAELQKATNFIIVTDKEQADAALKVYVRDEADGDEPEDKSVALFVRLVNSEGFVVYPNLKRVSGWKYVGVISKLPPRIAQDLAKATKSKK